MKIARMGYFLSLLAILNMALFVPAAKADIIPARLPSSESEATKKVTERLVDLGLNEEEARSHVEELSPSTTLHYAHHPDSLQPASGIYVEEFLLGAAFLGLVALIGVSLFTGDDDDD